MPEANKVYFTEKCLDLYQVACNLGPIAGQTKVDSIKPGSSPAEKVQGQHLRPEFRIDP